MISGIYIHIPFCRRGCTYCHFVTVPCETGTVRSYCRALIKEMQLYAGSCREEIALDSVYIGGGTPSLIPAEYLAEILQACRDSFPMEDDCEISTEANPDTIQSEKARIYRQVGINRVSVGVQSLQGRELEAIGRSHSSNTAVDSVQILKQNGIENINLDLLIGLPSQNLDSLKGTRWSITRLGVPHLSVYMLDLDEPCALSDFVSQGSISVPEDDETAEMYMHAHHWLSEFGYQQYEISNFTRGNRHCRHNLKYWTRVPVIGFGLASHSFDGICRYANTDQMKTYLSSLESGKSPVAWRRILNEEEMLQEKLFLGLRLNRGIQWDKLLEEYPGEWIDKYEQPLRKLDRQGLVQWKNSTVRLTTRGMLLSNEIFQLFV
ncbi:MAG: radical SAM family heme chaperone HemW [Acidobacteriota bacterium]